MSSHRSPRPGVVAVVAWFHPDPDLPGPKGEEDRDDMAAQGFLRLLAELRTILLQDSVLLRQEFPGRDHEIRSRVAARLQQSRQHDGREEVQLQQAFLWSQIA